MLCIVVVDMTVGFMSSYTFSAMGAVTCMELMRLVTCLLSNRVICFYFTKYTCAFKCRNKFYVTVSSLLMSSSTNPMFVLPHQPSTLMNQPYMCIQQYPQQNAPDHPYITLQITINSKSHLCQEAPVQQTPKSHLCQEAPVQQTLTLWAVASGMLGTTKFWPMLLGTRKLRSMLIKRGKIRKQEKEKRLQRLGFIHHLCQNAYRVKLQTSYAIVS